MSEGNGDASGDGKSLAELCVLRRKEVRRKKTLSSTAKLLFDALTDDAFLNKYSVGFGIIRIGKPTLADELGCSVPTITRSQSELSPSELWTRTSWYEGHEITLWFLRGIASNQLEFDQFTQGVTKSPRTRVAPRVTKLRNGHGHFCKAGDLANLPAKTEATADLTVYNGQDCRATPVIPAVEATANLTVANRQTQPSGHGKNDVGQRSDLTGVNGHSHHNGNGTNDVGTTSKVTGYKDADSPKEGEETGSDKPPTPDLALEEKFKKWESRLDDMRNSDLRKQEPILVREFQSTALGTPARDIVSRKLVAVRLRLYGPKAPEATVSKAKTATATTPKPMPFEKHSALGKAEVARMREAAR